MTPGAEEFDFIAMPVAGLEAMTARTARSFPRHTHDQYGVGIIDRGGHRSVSDRCMVEAGPGSIICVNPGEVHDGHAIGGRERRWRMLYLDPGLVRQTLDQIDDGEESSLIFERAAFDDPELRRLIDELLRSGRESCPLLEPLRVETSLLKIIARLGKGRAHSTVELPGAASLRRVRELIEADPTDEGLSLARLAREANVSRYRLVRLFARHYCLTPHAYIVQKRLSLARTLLRSGGSVADVAHRTGFSDQSHLTRSFARQFGIAPARYAAVLGGPHSAPGRS